MRYEHLGHSSNKTIQRECCKVTFSFRLQGGGAKTLLNARSPLLLVIDLTWSYEMSGLSDAFYLPRSHSGAWLTTFLSHLLIARCDIGVQLSVRSSVRPFVRSFVVRPSVHNLCQGAYSVVVIAGSMKPCIVITLDTHLKKAP